MEFLREWARLVLVGDAWVGRILRWVALLALLGIGLFLRQSITVTVGAVKLAPSAGLALGTVLALVWLSVTAGLAWGRTGAPAQTPAFLKHLENLQAFAEQARNSAKNVAVPIDMSKPMGRYFRSHYPLVAGKLDRWSLIEELPKQTKFWDAMRHEERRLGLTNNGVALLASLAEADVEFDQLAWSVENDAVVVRVAITMWQVAGQPQGTAFEDIKREVRQHVPVLRALPEVVAYVDAKKQREEQRAGLVDDLETIMATHRLTGRCDGCPWKTV